jgi:hypothetical protein
VRKHRNRPRSLAAFLRLVTTSLLFLCGGALIAVSFEGALRLVFGVAGFAGYVFFFARALRELVLPKVLIEGGPRPDGEVQKRVISSNDGRGQPESHPHGRSVTSSRP